MYGFANRLIPLYYAAANSRRLLSSPAAAAETDRISDPHNNHERKRRKEEPLENVVTLTCESSADGGVCNVYVIGSDHKSPKSWAEIKAVMQLVKPEAVFLELCASRRHILAHDKIEVIEAQKTGKVDADMMKQVICELTKQDPIGVEIDIHERDQYMSFKILEDARQHKSVVAVVGRAHVPGIQNNWKQHVEVEQLLNVPLQTKMLIIAARVVQVACLFGSYLCIKKMV